MSNQSPSAATRHSRLTTAESNQRSTQLDVAQITTRVRRCVLRSRVACLAEATSSVTSCVADVRRGVARSRCRCSKVEATLPASAKIGTRSSADKDPQHEHPWVTATKLHRCVLSPGDNNQPLARWSNHACCTATMPTNPLHCGINRA